MKSPVAALTIAASLCSIVNGAPSPSFNHHRLFARHSHGGLSIVPADSPTNAVIPSAADLAIQVQSVGVNPHQGFRSVAYFINWGIYARKYEAKQLPVKDLTHVLYAFALVNDGTGEVTLSDPWSDSQYDRKQEDNNLHGSIGQLNQLKADNRHLKVLLSVGGYNNSPNFTKPASTPEGRQLFAESATEIVKNYGFDGLDIDWEYPANKEDANNYVALLKTIRLELNKLEVETNQYADEDAHFELSVAAPAGSQYEVLDITAMDEYLDFWNIMAYDYYFGEKNSVHNANLFASKVSNATTFITEDSVEYYKGQGVNPCKIVIGNPLYTRSFKDSGGLGKPHGGFTEKGSFEAGSFDYKRMDLTKALYDEDAVAAYSYDKTSKVFHSWDSPQSISKKIDWIKQQKLGGAMWWSADADRDDDSSLIRIAANSFRAEGSQSYSQNNNLFYPTSKFPNLKVQYRPAAVLNENTDGSR